jgi:hypothetical protein
VKVDFDVPTLHIAIEQGKDIELGIGANEKGRFAIEEFGAFGIPG